MSVFFVGVNFYSTLTNIFLFLFLLMLSGSIYGIVFSAVLYIKNFRAVNKKISRELSEKRFKLFLFFGFLCILFFYFSWLFLYFGILIVLISLLYSFAKGLEDCSMIKEISGKNLREGDWLAEDVKIGTRTIKANWEGLGIKEIKLLSKKNRVKIKEGMPFVPAFLIAFLLYVFLGDFIIRFVFGLI
jgi:prepilin signal peptidase PulO-like enzyme (type II secretory pathway)